MTDKPPTSLSTAAIAAVLAAGGGWSLHSVVLPDQEPAVLAAAVSSMRDDLREVRDDLREVRDDLSTTRDDRWTRTMMQQWLSSEYHPHRDALADHVRLPGHQSGMHQVRALQDEVRSMSLQIQQLHQGD